MNANIALNLGLCLICEEASNNLDTYLGSFLVSCLLKVKVEVLYEVRQPDQVASCERHARRTSVYNGE